MEVIKKIQLKKRFLDFHLDENEEMIYLKDYPKNLISVLDCKTTKIIKEISIEKPHGIALNPKLNRLFVPSGSRGFFNKINPVISIIDMVSHEIIDSVEYKDEKILGFFLKCNPETNSFYFENKGNLSLIHGDDYSLEKSIIKNQKINHFEIDKNKNILYCTSEKTNFLLIYDGTDYKLKKSIPINLSDATVGKLLLNPHKNLIYLWYSWDYDGYSGKYHMDILDTEGNILVKGKKFGVVDNVTISISSGNVYVTKSNRSEIHKFDYLLHNTVEVLPIKNRKSFKDKLWKNSDFWNPVFDSKHNKIYVGDGKDLLIIKD